MSGVQREPAGVLSAHRGIGKLHEAVQVGRLTMDATAGGKCTARAGRARGAVLKGTIATEDGVEKVAAHVVDPEQRRATLGEACGRRARAVAAFEERVVHLDTDTVLRGRPFVGSRVRPEPTTSYVCDLAGPSGRGIAVLKDGVAHFDGAVSVSRQISFVIGIPVWRLPPHRETPADCIAILRIDDATVREVGVGERECADGGFRKNTTARHDGGAIGKGCALHGEAGLHVSAGLSPVSPGAEEQGAASADFWNGRVAVDVDVT